MKQEHIEAFLEVVNTRNITKAAENLHLAQSTISHYLTVMEEEIGKPLFIRSRGIKNVELTVYGEEFIPLAENWIKLIMQTEALKSYENMSLDIASIDSLNDSVIFPVIERFMQEHPHIYIKTKTASSNIIYKLAENREIDIGFVGYQLYRPHVSTELAFQEHMCVVRNRKNMPEICVECPNDLKEQDEIRLRWGYENEDWHDANWNNMVPAMIETDSMLMLRRSIQQPGKWAVLPRIECAFFMDHNLQICDFGENNPPKRKIYQVIPKRIRPNHREALKMFQQYLDAFLKENPQLE